MNISDCGADCNKFFLATYLISAQPKSRLVTPANAGIQAAGTEILDSRLRGMTNKTCLATAFVAQFSIVPQH
jgi:hypothetical protein